MQIRRNYNGSFFQERRRKRGCARGFFYITLLLGGLVLIVYTQFDELVGTATSIFREPLTPTPLPSQLAGAAAEQYQLGNLQQAADLFAQAVELRPDNIDYLYEYGQILIDLDQADKALEISEQLTDHLAPNDPRGYALKARSLVWQGTPALAIAEGQKGLTVDRTFAPLYVALARAYTNSGRWQDGLEYAELGIQLAPNDARAHWSYAHALASVGAFDEAQNELEITLDLNPNFTLPMFELAFLYLAQNLDQDAIDLYDQIISREPFNARAHLRQCEAYRKVGQFERAVGYCRDAVTLDPSLEQAHFRLGLLLYNQRNFGEAQQSFQACIDLKETNVECKYRLGLTHYYLGDCDTGYQILEDSIVIAQAQDSGLETEENIRAGIEAIRTDKERCPNFTRPRVFATIEPPTPVSEEND